MTSTDIGVGENGTRDRRAVAGLAGSGRGGPRLPTGRRRQPQASARSTTARASRPSSSPRRRSSTRPCSITVGADTTRVRRESRAMPHRLLPNTRWCRSRAMPSPVPAGSTA
jgi:hypothetical protein